MFLIFELDKSVFFLDRISSHPRRRENSTGGEQRRRLEWDDFAGNDATTHFRFVLFWHWATALLSFLHKSSQLSWGRSVPLFFERASMSAQPSMKVTKLLWRVLSSAQLLCSVLYKGLFWRGSSSAQLLLRVTQLSLLSKICNSFLSCNFWPASVIKLI